MDGWIDGDSNMSTETRDVGADSHISTLPSMYSLKYANTCHRESGLLLLQTVKNVKSCLPSMF